MRRIVVVGASLAGVAAAEELRLRGFDGDLVLLGAEDRLPYDRPPLSKQLLSGAIEPDQCLLRTSDWHERLDIQLRLGTPAVDLDANADVVTLSNGQLVNFDGLVIATGATPVTFPGDRLKGVHTLRTIEDALAIRSALAAGADVAIVGGGFIGAEVAATASEYGVSVTLIEALGAPLSRVLGEKIGNVCARLHADHAVKLRCGVPVAAIQGGSRVDRVVLADGEVVAADLVVVGLGVRPCTEWLARSGLRVADGVVCDAFCRTSSSRIVAAGDVARWNHPIHGSIRVEHWEHAVSQAQAAAVSLVDPDRARPFAQVPYVWSDQYDVKIQLVGRPAPGDQLVVVEGRPDDYRFVALYSCSGRLTGGLSFNRRAATARIRALLGTGASLKSAVASFAELDTQSDAMSKPVGRTRHAEGGG